MARRFTVSFTSFPAAPAGLLTFRHKGEPRPLDVVVYSRTEAAKVLLCAISWTRNKKSLRSIYATILEIEKADLPVYVDEATQALLAQGQKSASQIPTEIPPAIALAYANLTTGDHPPN